MNNHNPFLTEANGKIKFSQRPGDENASLFFLRSPRERSMIPSTMDKIEFSVWVEKEPGESISKRFKTFHEYFGKPKFRPVDNISNEQMPTELNKLQEVMKAHKVMITNYTEVADREVYRFITKELFGMLTTGEFYSVTKLVYEEFHPNREYLIKKAASDFIRLIFETYLGPYRLNHQKHLLQNYKEIKRLLKTYEDNIGLDFLEMDELSFDGDSACIIMELGFYGIMNDVFVHHYEGDCKCFLEKSGTVWQVTHCSLPERIK
ncbi:MAG: hypothetical protein IPP71_10220 [Bacteroidetes bacterium]|nr:hypothetical protein [Bacteroidota bacterium]